MNKKFDSKHPIDCILYRGENDYTVITRTANKLWTTYIGPKRIYRRPFPFNTVTFNSELLIDSSDYPIIIRDIFTLPFTKD
jgi:hypothetical protein